MIERRFTRLWIPILPIWLASVAAMILSLVYTGNIIVLTIPLLAFSIVLSIVEGILIARDLPIYKNMEKRATQLEAVHSVIRKAGRSLELQDILDTITKLTVEVTGVKGCSIKLFDEKTGTMKVKSLAGIKREASDMSIQVAENIYHKSLVEGNVLFMDDAMKKDFPELDDESESLICIPLKLENKPLGALCVYGEKGESLSQDIISFLASLGELVTLSIANATVYENLKRLNETKSWFLLKSSHELKSPLNAIQSMARILSEGYLGELNEKQKELIERIDNRAKSLSKIVQDLIDLARGKAEITLAEREKINLCELFEEAVRFYQARAEEKGVLMEIVCATHESIVYGRRDGLQSIITNLLSNAIKYTNRGGKVTLRMLASGDDVVIEISDTGIGIPKPEQEKLFREFFRASNAKQLTENGTGLGLAIVKENVERHGGKIDFTSEEGKGTTFRVTLRRVSK